jgi:hypothetical protein
MGTNRLIRELPPIQALESSLSIQPTILLDNLTVMDDILKYHGRTTISANNISSAAVAEFEHMDMIIRYGPWEMPLIMSAVLNS